MALNTDIPEENQLPLLMTNSDMQPTSNYLFTSPYSYPNEQFAHNQPDSQTRLPPPRDLLSQNSPESTVNYALAQPYEQPRFPQSSSYQMQQDSKGYLAPASSPQHQHGEYLQI